VTWRNASFGTWAFLALALVGLVVIAISTTRVAKLGDVAQILLGRSWRRATWLLMWMWLGWHFFAR
jgi:hypothetical protein